MPAELWREYRDGTTGQIHVWRARPEDSDAIRRPPVLCLHMTPYSGRVYRELLAELGTDREVLAPDTPGYGASDPPAEPPRIEDYATIMLDLVEGAGLGPVDVLGYHTGSSIAIEMSVQRPDLVRRLALVSVAAFPEDTLDERRAIFGASRAEEVDETGDYLKDRWDSYRINSMADYPARMRAIRFPDALLRPDISWWGHAAVYDHPVLERLAMVDAPILLLDPEDDLAHVTARARGALRGSSEYRELPGWRHGLLQVRAMELSAILRGFLDREEVA